MSSYVFYRPLVSNLDFYPCLHTRGKGFLLIIFPFMPFLGLIRSDAYIHIPYTPLFTQLSLAWTTHSIDFSPLGLFGKLSVHLEELFAIAVPR
jgi:hypothetical protein